MNRRHFLASSLVATLGQIAAQEKRAPRIVLRSSWQTVNIGDIAHTPGMLHLLEQHVPDAEVRLWPSSVSDGVEEMLMKRFPKLKIIKGRADILAMLKECDFMLHGSGPGFVAQKDVEKWHKETGKPFGIGGITFSDARKETAELLSAAKFVFFRDSVSLQFAKDHGVTCPLMEFGPDGAFAVDLRNDKAADVFMKANGLEDGKFMCCIARFRNTPYWVIKRKNKAFDEKKDARNQAMKAHDSAPLVAAIISVVRETGMKVLLCPEDETQMAINKEVLFDKLPDDVKAKVVWRDKYWLTDEALSTYVRSAGIFGHEMHSPIMCIGNGIPAIVCRWAEQTSKGFMWRDIGLNDWLFTLDNEEEIPRVAPAVLAMAKDPAGAKAKVAKAAEIVKARQTAMMDAVKKSAAV